MKYEIRKLKCRCCKWYDDFDYCEVIDCNESFEISLDRIKEVSNNENMSISDIISLINYDS